MTARTRGQDRSRAREPFWKRDLGSRGRRSSGPDDQDVVEHPPFTPRLPAVNLLPASVRESLAIARVRRWLIVAVLVLAAAAGALWWLQGSRIEVAEQSLAAAEAQGAALRDQAASLTAVKEFNAQLAAQRELVSATLASQPQTTEVVRRLIAAGGDPVAFLSIGVDYTGIPAVGDALNACPNPDPFGTDVTIGCLTFTAVTDDRQEVSRLLEAMEADPLFVGPYVSSSALSSAGDVAGSLVNFTGTAGISIEALRTPLAAEQLEALLNPPAAEDAESAEGTPAPDGGS